MATAKQIIGIPMYGAGPAPQPALTVRVLCTTPTALRYYAKRTSSANTHRDKNHKSELQPGDLVFFASSSGWYVSHVGMYIGDGQFIHASSGSGVVKISDLSNWYYSTYFYGAARMLS